MKTNKQTEIGPNSVDYVDWPESAGRQYAESAGTKRIRRKITYMSRRRSVFEYSILVVLLIAVIASILMFGSVRMWSIGAASCLVFTVGILTAVRSCFIERKSLVLPPAVFPLFLLLIYVTAGLWYAQVPITVLTTSICILAVLVFYLSAVQITGVYKRWRIAVLVICLFVSCIDWYSLVQHVRGGPIYVLNILRTTYGMRASGTYICPNHFAALLAIVLCLCLALLFIKRAGLPLRLVAGYTFVLTVPVLLLTQSRSGVLGSMAGCSVVLWFVLGRKSKKWYYILPVLLPLLGLLILAGFWAMSPVLRERIAGSNPSNPDAAVQIRFVLWSDTWNMIKDNMLKGLGAGSYRWAYPEYRTHTQQLWARYTHNEYLQWWAETGLVGMLLSGLSLVCFVVPFAKRAFTASRNRDAYLSAAVLGALAATLVHAIFDFNMHVLANMLVFAFLAGITVSCWRESGEYRSAQGRTLWNVTKIVLLLALSIAGICLSLCMTGTDLLMRAGNKEAEMLQDQKAMAFYNAARSVQPLNFEAWRAVAGIHTKQAFWERDAKYKVELAKDAIHLYQKSLQYNSYDADSWYGISSVLDSAGKPDEAEKALQRAIEIDPLNAFFHVRMGMLLRNHNKYPEAVECFQRAISLERHNTQTKFQLNYTLKNMPK